jgi:hypothetical protein
VSELRANGIEVPLPRRYGPGHRTYEQGMAAHRLAVAQNLPAYRDPVTGFAVFTAVFLASRGTCCDSGCRHCPFVPRRA